MRVLSWNLFHGRARPEAGRELLAEFTAALSGWEWDIALLQEVPPWWPAPLAAALGAQERHVLTSRNSLAALRRWVAVRHPDLIKSNGGGANAILVRHGAVAEHRRRRLGLLPERRWMHAVRLDTGVWLANVHLQPATSQAQAANTVLQLWGDGAPRILGGDFNLRSVELQGLRWCAGHEVDHVLAAGLEPGTAAVLDHGRLSDHAPVVVELRRARPPGA